MMTLGPAVARSLRQYARTTGATADHLRAGAFLILCYAHLFYPRTIAPRLSILATEAALGGNEGATLGNPGLVQQESPKRSLVSDAV